MVAFGSPIVYNVCIMDYHKKGKEHPQYRHGMNSTRPYKIWCGMKRRCYNKNELTYLRYGAVGIKMSKDWLDFVNFWNDMKDTYFDTAQIDRIDNSKGYCKENCRWVTIKEQQNNKHSVKHYEYKGKKMCLPDWDKELGFKKGTIRARIKTFGWNIEKALSAPKKKYCGYSKARGLYQVEVKRNRKRYFVGRYKTKKEALEARSNFLLEILNKEK